MYQREVTTSASDVSFSKACERDLSSKMGVSSLPVPSFDFSVSPSPQLLANANLSVCVNLPMLSLS